MNEEDCVLSLGAGDDARGDRGEFFEAIEKCLRPFGFWRPERGHVELFGGFFVSREDCGASAVTASGACVEVGAEGRLGGLLNGGQDIREDKGERDQRKDEAHEPGCGNNLEEDGREDEQQDGRREWNEIVDEELRRVSGHVFRLGERPVDHVF